MGYGKSVELKGKRIELPSCLNFDVSDLAKNLGKIEALSEKCAWHFVRKVLYKFEYNSNTAVDEFAESTVDAMLKYIDLNHRKENSDVKYSIVFSSLIDRLSVEDMVQFVLDSGVRPQKCSAGLFHVKFVSRGYLEAVEELNKLADDVKSQDELLTGLTKKYARLKITLADLQKKKLAKRE